MHRPMKVEVLRELVKIPSVGPRTAEDLYDLGIRGVFDLTRQTPEELFEKLCKLRGKQVDSCTLYIFRAARRYAEKPDTDPEELKWWLFKD
ncbi:MAG TPA: helix-hairpin-helix domain-containing protein [bacterium]|nr:helix-hairpin-helix domain-containing protein [bacterium]